MDPASLLEYRRRRDEFFAHDPRSPLPPEERREFSGLSYYPPNPHLVFHVPLIPVPPEPVTIATTTGEERVYEKVATVTLEIAGVSVTPALYSMGHPRLFLPFRDATSGVETYGAGRYLDVDPEPGGTVVVDFNMAYNPFCAYDDAYSCALPPYENWLPVPIRAGERHERAAVAR